VKVARIAGASRHSRLETEPIFTPTLKGSRRVYGCTSWNPYRKYQIGLLEQVQRRAARFVTRTYSREEGRVTQALNHLNRSPLQHKRQTVRLCMLYKSLNQQADETIPTYVQHQSLLCSRRAHPIKFIPLQASCDAYKFSFWPRTINDWNNLPAEIITSDSLSQFKSALNMQNMTS